MYSFTDTGDHVSRHNRDMHRQGAPPRRGEGGAPAVRPCRSQLVSHVKSSVMVAVGLRRKSGAKTKKKLAFVTTLSVRPLVRPSVRWSDHKKRKRKKKALLSPQSLYRHL